MIVLFSYEIDLPTDPIHPWARERINQSLAGSIERVTILAIAHPWGVDMMPGSPRSDADASASQTYFTDFIEFGEVDALLANEKELEPALQQHPALIEFFRFAELLRYLRTQAFLSQSKDCSNRYQQEKNLGALFTALLKQRHNGVVLLEYKNQGIVILAMQAGEPAAIWSGLPNERYGRYLVEQLRLLPAQQDLLYNKIKQDAGSLGVALLESNTLMPEDFPQSVRNWSIGIWRSLVPQQIHGFRVYLDSSIEHMAAPLKESLDQQPQGSHLPQIPSSLSVATALPTSSSAPTSAGSKPMGLVIEMSAADRMGEANRQFRFAQQALRAGQYEQATSALEQCIALWPQQDAEKLAFLAVAQGMIGRYPEAILHAQQALQLSPDICLGWLALHKIADLQQQTLESKKHLKAALDALERTPGYGQDFQLLRSLKRQSPTSAISAGKYPVLHLLGLIAVTCLLFALSNGRKMGQHEYLYQLEDGFFWGRRVSLLLIGWLGWSLFRGLAPWTLWRQHMRFQGSTNYWFGLLAWGALIGFCSPTQRIQSEILPLLAMTSFHVLAEESFFRGWLASFMHDLLHDTRLAILCSSILYGVYHITYYSFWYETGPIVALTEIGLISLFAAVPYHFFALRTGSLLAPIICHLLVMWTMMASSIIQRV